MLLAAEWDSLEVAKLLVAALTPILLFALGLIVSRSAKRVEQAQWANRTLIGRRLDLYEQMAPKLNDLLCFFLLVGHFREVTPPKALARKRELDKIFHTHAPLFTREFVHLYFEFMNLCFEPFTGVARQAKLRADVFPQQLERAEGWKDEWIEMFSDRSERSDTGAIEAAYHALMETFALDVGAGRSSPQGRRG